MAYQFFAKSPSRAPPPSTPPSPAMNKGGTSNQIRSASNSNKPPIILPRPKPPQSSIASTKPRVDVFGPEPYPLALSSYPTPHPQISIDPVNTAHIPSLTRITGLLLPIRYPNKFYTATITDPVIASVSRVALFHDHPVTSVPSTFSTSAKSSSISSNTDKVIGGIRCRLESHVSSESPAAATDGIDSVTATNLYIQTLHLLSPHRGNGVAKALLDSLLFEPPSSSTTASSRKLSPLVKHYNIRTVTAHVHETNDEALRWYAARGFRVQDGVVEGYYRRLSPGGAKIVRLELPPAGLGGVENKKEESPCEQKVAPQEIVEASGMVKEEVQEKLETEEVAEEDDEEDDDWEKIEAPEEGWQWNGSRKRRKANQ